MRTLSSSVALATPPGPDGHLTNRAVESAQQGSLETEIRLGVGPSSGGIPARVLGHAGCIQAALRSDVLSLAGRPARIFIFSSAPKSGNSNTAAAVEALAALGGALRVVGVDLPITVELADAKQEVPDTLSVVLPESLTQWYERAAHHCGSQADPRWYALEHAAPSMFGDLTNEPSPPLRITLGAVPEARFWAARWRVRSAALRQGLSVAPGVGLILKSLKAPWYNRVAREPLLREMTKDPAAVADALDDAANPQLGGNAGLTREARATRRLVAHPGLTEFVASCADTPSAVRFLREAGFQIGHRLTVAMEDIA